MHFGENQLSRSLIGLSPLTTGHPPGFQPWWVRASTRSYPRFTLPMVRSLRFGSRARDWDARFGLAFATAPPHGTSSLSVARECLALGGGPPRFRRNILRLTWEHRWEERRISSTGLLPAVAAVSKTFDYPRSL